ASRQPTYAFRSKVEVESRRLTEPALLFFRAGSSRTQGTPSGTKTRTRSSFGESVSSLGNLPCPGCVGTARGHPGWLPPVALSGSAFAAKPFNLPGNSGSGAVLSHHREPTVRRSSHLDDLLLPDGADL